jgi:hypothetical protein
MNNQGATSFEKEYKQGLQNKYELAIQSTIKEVSIPNGPPLGGQLLIQKNMNEIMSQYNLDTSELVKEVEIILKRTLQ